MTSGYEIYDVGYDSKGLVMRCGYEICDYGYEICDISYEINSAGYEMWLWNMWY